MIKRITRRLINARKRMKLLAICALLVSLIASAHIYTTTWIYPNTFLNGKPVGGTTKLTIETQIESYLHTPYHMRVKNRDYTYSYADFGIEINSQEVSDALFTPNKKPFPNNIIALLYSLSKPRYLSTPLVFTQDFDRFIDQTIYNFGERANEIIFDQKEKALTYVENEETYRIDSEAFKKLLTSRINNRNIPLYPKLVKVTNVSAVAIADTAERIKRMFLTPLTVYIDAGEVSKSFILTERELADISTITWQNNPHDRFVDIHGDLVFRIINEHVKKIRVLVKGNVVSPKVIKDLEDALISRFNGHPVDAIKIYYDKGPNSDGTLAAKYLEVDISQQKMYTFAKNKLLKEYRVSTGRDYPTPTGEFTILNKTGLGYSTIYSVWMPWWMGFKYSDELHAYFGVHELPYSLTDGNKIQRPASFIGTPNTGGCVALGVGDAKAVYQFADIGTKVVIYK